MTKLFANPYVRLGGRALVAGIASGLLFYRSQAGGSAAWHGAVVAGVLAFCEVFTPLNSLVGLWKAPAK